MSAAQWNAPSLSCAIITMQTHSSLSASEDDAITHQGNVSWENACWTTEDEAAMIEFLSDNLDGATCEQHVQWICLVLLVKKGCILKQIKVVEGNLKTTYHDVVQLRLTSGIPYSNENGVDVNNDTRAQWDEMVKKNKHLESFTNTGWPHFHAMAQLMPSKATNS
ncbi:hypothetical protein F5148DRAFT_1147613 [Russula earlei]|uniref:Uncharacterized protein n=1 Tax=Russula earlei TaxID=71964 RepID=A0ACC0UFI0_9AGAM|nr:hypothetical protein F5148DRAFT_1147613 [Russula earlei]